MTITEQVIYTYTDIHSESITVFMYGGQKVSH